ncbi:MAG: hypothetical protein QM680_10005 [Luteolibacter sp.]
MKVRQDWRPPDINEKLVDDKGTSVSRRIDLSRLDEIDFTKGRTQTLKIVYATTDIPYSTEDIIFETFRDYNNSFDRLSLQVFTGENETRAVDLEQTLVENLRLQKYIPVKSVSRTQKKQSTALGIENNIQKITANLTPASIPLPEKITIPWLFANLSISTWLKIISILGALCAISYNIGVFKASLSHKNSKPEMNSAPPFSSKAPHSPASEQAETPPQ